MRVRRRRPLLPAGAVALAALLPSAGHDAQAQQGQQAPQLVLGTTRNLDFGRFVAGSGGTVVVSPTGLRSRTGGVVLLNSPSAGQAGFIVGRSGIDSGGSFAVIVSVPADGSIRLTNGASSMAVNGFVSNPATIDAVPNGGVALSVGATLVVAPNQPPGAYSGAFPLTVNYQ